MPGIDLWEATVLGITFAPVVLVIALLAAWLWKSPTKLLRKLRGARSADAQVEKLRRERREAAGRG
ncbi:hypothetical protein KRX56_07445 [Dermabacteraceae bacterium TAE3-ERU27]|nr:hypothetical protein [Dermabacteraceae bacterium TAE3-ERU27]